jgi:flagellar hook-length control protein FliK
LTTEGGNEVNLLTANRSEGDPKLQTPEGDLVLLAEGTQIPSVPDEATKIAHEVLTNDPRQKAPPLRAPLGGTLKQRGDEAVPSYSSTPSAKGEGDSQPRAMTPGQSAAQTMVEGRIAQLPKPAVAQDSEASKVQPDMPLEPKQSKRAEGGLQFAPASGQSAPRPSAAPLAPIHDQRSPREQNFQDRATPVPSHAQLIQVPKAAPAHTTAAVQPAIGAALGPRAIGAELPERAIIALEQDGLQGLMSQDRPIAATTAAGGAFTAGVETARHAASQIATAVIQSNGKATEIALNPEELGRVRMSLSAADGALTLVVLADRPETQELLRRHIDVLAQEFRSLGYESVSFSFHTGGQSDSAEDRDSADEETKTLMKQSVETEEAIAPILSSGLDLRL